MKHKINSRLLFFFVTFFLAILAIGALLTWFLVKHADHDKRDDLLQQARMVSEGVNIDRIEALTGTEADLKKPEYLRLKEQLMAVRSANWNCRFIYLLGRKANGDIFFFVDSEPSDSKDYSPPGQVYQEASDGFRHAFATSTEIVDGPYTDRWGKWVSSIVPIQDPKTVISGLATLNNARELVRKAVDFYRKNGRERFLKEVNNPQGEFCKRDLYAFVYDSSMTMRAHPVKPELVGQNQINQKDWVGGKYFRKEIQEVALSKGHGWVDYEYQNPLSKQRAPKTTYIERADDLIICAGAYKGTGAVLAVLAMDVDASSWKSMLSLVALPSILFTLALLVILVIGSLLLLRRAGIAGAFPFWMERIELGLVFSTGLVLTLFIAWFVHKGEMRDDYEAFRQLSASQAKQIAEHFLQIRDSALVGLAHFCETSENTAPGKLRQFAQYWEKNSLAKAWEWVPAVSAANREPFETGIRDAGLTELGIWEKDAQGKRVPAADRVEYYPVSLVAPLSGNEGILGFDLGTEPLQRAAMAEARSAGLVTASDPFPRKEGASSESRKMMLIYRPVFDSDAPKLLNGFAAAVVEMESLLTGFKGHRVPFMELSLLRKDAPPEVLANSWDEDHLPSKDFSQTYFICSFGKVFALTAFADPAFLQTHRKFSGWWVILIGTILTVMLSALIDAMSRQRHKLERLVIERTKALHDSEEAYRNQFNKNSVVMLLIDPKDGAIIDANAAAVDFYGYSRETLLTMRMTDINTARPAVEVLSAEALSRKEQGKRQQVQHRRSDGSLRDVDSTATSIQFGKRQVFHLIIFDITEQKKAEEALRESEELLKNAQMVAGLGSYVLDITTGLWKGSVVLDKVFGIDEAYERSVEGWTALLHPDDRAKMIRYFRDQVLGKGQPFDKEYRIIRHHDKVERWVKGVGNLEFDAQGHPSKMHGTIQDITDKKNVENNEHNRMDELEVFYQASIGREERILELKDEVERLKKELSSYKKL